MSYMCTVADWVNQTLKSFFSNTSPLITFPRRSSNLYFLHNTTQCKSQEGYNIGRTDLLPVLFLKNKSTCMNFQDHGLC